MKSRFLQLPGHNQHGQGDGLLTRLSETARDHGDRPAIGGLECPWMTHHALDQLVQMRARELLKMGWGRGDIILLALPDGPENLTAFLSIASVAIVVPIDPDESGPVIQSLVRDLPVKAAVIDERRRNSWHELGLDVPTIPILTSPTEPAGWWRFPKVEFACETAPPSEVADAAVLVRTAGTTAKPKIVAWSQSSLLVSSDTMADWMGLNHQDRSLCVMPFSHLHSVVRSTLPCLLRGGSVFCAPGFDRHRVFQWLSAYRITFMTAVPAIYRSMLGQMDVGESSLPSHSLRFVASGSDGIDRKTVNEIQNRLGCPVREFYGLSEVAPMLVAIPRAMQARLDGCVGTKIDPWEMVCHSEEGIPVPAGTEGELVVRGGMINPALEQLQDSEPRDCDSWFQTGDLAIIHQDGTIAITGRTDHRINRGGQKVSPTRVRTILNGHPDVVDAAVFPMADAVLGQKVAAAVVLENNLKLSENHLRGYVARQLPDYMVPESLVVIESLPRNRAGKIDHERLRAIVQEQAVAEGNRSKRVHPRNATEATLTNLFRERLQTAEFDLETDFTKLGGDSFEAAVLIISISEAFGTMLSPAEFLEHGSVSSLATYIAAQKQRNVENLALRMLRQGGDSAPLFLAHSVFGQTYYAEFFSRYGPSNRTIYVMDGRTLTKPENSPWRPTPPALWRRS